MKTVHLLRSEPGKMIKDFIDEISKENECKTVLLYQDPIDYDLCIEYFFECERIISWW